MTLRVIPEWKELAPLSGILLFLIVMLGTTFLPSVSWITSFGYWLYPVWLLISFTMKDGKVIGFTTVSAVLLGIGFLDAENRMFFFVLAGVSWFVALGRQAIVCWFLQDEQEHFSLLLRILLAVFSAGFLAYAFFIFRLAVPVIA